MSAPTHAVAAVPAATRKVLLVAGEASGDLHGAGLVTALRRADPTIEVWGVGGERLRHAGMHILVDTAAVATMGFVETFGTLGRLLSTYRQLKRFMIEERPALLVLIDYPEFNLFLAKRAKALGIPVFYYIGPQVWAWRRSRVRKIARRVDRLGVVFPFEPTLYNNGQQLAEFVGHPLLDLVRPTRAREDTLARYQLDPQRRLLAVLPGSRKKEVRLLLPPAIAAAEQLQRRGWQAVIALAHTLTRADLTQASGGRLLPIPVIEDDTYNVVHAADAVLVASGTATLETALLGRPMVIMYRVSPLTFAIARLLVRVEHIGMPNIILGQRVFPELMQGDVTGDKLAAAIEDVSARRDEVAAALSTLRGTLGEPGAAERAAQLALELMA
ncbi:MAG TPA: lipid-A-disaccharide synthase [Candidatus Margulisiibacteriota bacterium]|nr:lipid-A-disaccharide synthase [Candidatus Margulisiibacteriota bacterium]